MTPMELAAEAHRPSPMKRHQLWIVLVPVLFPGLAHSLSVEVKVGGMAELPCNYRLPDKASLPLYRVYWQRDFQVVSALVNGGEDASLQHWRYANRTHLDLPSLTLFIDPVQVADQGGYECIVFQMKSSYEVIHQGHVDLSVVGTVDFSMPIILASGPSDMRSRSGVRLQCTAHGGYPEPWVSWVNRKLNATFTGLLSNTTIALQDPQTGLYNVTGELILNTTEELSMACVVTAGDRRVSSSSLSVNVPIPSSPPPLGTAGRRHTEVIVAMCAILSCVLLMAAVMLRRHVSCPSQEDPVCVICMPPEPPTAAPDEDVQEVVTLSPAESPA